MSQAIKLVTAPATEPVSVTDVKNYLRIDTSTDDAMLGDFIKAATRLIEKYTKRRLITQTWDLFLDQFPAQYNFDALRSEGVTDGKLSEYLHQFKFISIPLFPLQSVTSLNTYDEDDTAYLMPSTDYQVDTASEPGRLALRPNATWPSTVLRSVNGVIVRFVCGYGSAATDVPYELRQAIMQTVGYFYSNRGCAETEDSIPKTALALIQAFRVYRL